MQYQRLNYAKTVAAPPKIHTTPRPARSGEMVPKAGKLPPEKSLCEPVTTPPRSRNECLGAQMGSFGAHNTLETRTQGASATPTPRADAGESVGTRAGVI